ncbi:MAG: hypothetical protein ABI830_08790 [Pseudolabrys sp.]
MSRRAIAFAAAGLACCIMSSHASFAQTRAADDKLDPARFEKKLQDTRDLIGKERTTTDRPAITDTHQIVTDICKKNEQLPQCRL